MTGSATSPQEPVAPSHSLPYTRIDSMIGTSARPLSVSAYSTRGGTSGNVVRSTTPSSSRARRRRESVRGEMPASERSSSQKRERPSARSRTTRIVHLAQTMSAVRHTGQSLLAIDIQCSRNASRSEVSHDLALLGPAQDAEDELVAGCVEDVEEVVGRAQR